MKRPRLKLCIATAVISITAIAVAFGLWLSVMGMFALPLREWYLGAIGAVVLVSFVRLILWSFDCVAAHIS